MKKLVALFLVLSMILGMVAATSADEEVRTGYAQGFAGEVKVEVKILDGKIIGLEVDDSGESYPSAGFVRADTIEKLIEAILAAGTVEGVDTVAGATVTQKAVLEAVTGVLSEETPSSAPAGNIAFTAGEYEATFPGFNGDVTAKVTFSDSNLIAIEILVSGETDQIGGVAFEQMIPEMIEANGSGVDGVSGATFSSTALREIVNDAAAQAACSNLDAFKANRIEH